MKKLVKNYLLKKKKNILCKNSNMNFNVKAECTNLSSTIVNSNVSFEKIGEGCRVENIFSYGKVRLGRFVSISGPGTVLHAENNYIEIRDFCSIAQNVTIQEFNHQYNYPTTCPINFLLFNKNFCLETISKGPVVLEEDVWVGSNVVILSGVTIGRGAIIGAGSIVTKNIPAYAIACGNPAKVLRMRFSAEVIAKLEDLKWWNWDIDQLKKNINFFSTDLNEITNLEHLIQKENNNDKK